MKRGTPDHPKVKRLARRLRVPVFAAVGLLEMLWHWTAEQCPQGDVGRFDNTDIADAIYWPMESSADDLVAALIECRLVDHHPTHRLVIHDWAEHVDHAIHSRLYRAGKKFADGTTPRNSRLPKRERGEEEAKTEKERTEGSFDGLPSAQDEQKSALTRDAWPEPEPEPEPEPAAAANISDGSTAAISAATPPAAAIAEVLRTAMPLGTPPPDGDIVRRVQAAMQGASLAELAAAVIRYRKRGKTPNSYGFWPMFLQDTLAPDRRGDLGAISVPEQAAPRPSAPACQLCRGGGVMGRVAPDATPEGIRSAIRAGGRLCECEIGAGWADYFALDDDGDDVPVIRHSSAAGYAAVAQ